MLFSNSYMQTTLRPVQLRALIDEIAPKMIELQIKLGFDIIAFRGFSGASVAYPLSYATGIPLMLVRKCDDLGRPTDSSHGFAIECDSIIDVNKYLILDDFVSSGDTIRQTIKAINIQTKRRWMPNTSNYDVAAEVPYPKCVGVALYTTGYRSNSSVPLDGNANESIQLTYIANQQHS